VHRRQQQVSIKNFPGTLTAGRTDKTFVAPLVSASAMAGPTSTEQSMAMAQDAEPPVERTLDSGTLERIRELLGRYIESPDSNVDGLRDALRDLADDARARQIPPEYLLVVLKDLWRSLPQLRSATPSDEARLLQRVVSMSIAQYYRR